MFVIAETDIITMDVMKVNLKRFSQISMCNRYMLMTNVEYNECIFVSYVVWL